MPVEELKPLPKTRRIIDSYVQQDLLFSQNDALREQYVGGLSKIRMGRLMEGVFGPRGKVSLCHESKKLTFARGWG